jgi:hypothetical protein
MRSRASRMVIMRDDEAGGSPSDAAEERTLTAPATAALELEGIGTAVAFGSAPSRVAARERSSSYATVSPASPAPMMITLLSWDGSESACCEGACEDGRAGSSGERTVPALRVSVTTAVACAMGVAARDVVACEEARTPIT